VREIVRRLEARLPDVLERAESRGQTVTIHVLPGGVTVKLEWPPPVEDVRG